jgi:hypothetical protein
MINAQMLPYCYYTIGARNKYGQPLPLDTPAGTVRMAINVSGQSVQNNITYNGAQYVGLTHSKDITDKWVIDYKGKKLKVLYVNTDGRFTQVFMAVMQ